MLSAPLAGLLGLARRAGRLATGDVAVTELLNRQRARLLIVAGDAGPHTRRSFVQLADRHGVPCFAAGSKDELGHAVGQSPRAVVAVTDTGLAQGMLKHLMKEGEALVGIGEKGRPPGQPPL